MADDVFSALGDPTRRHIYSRLAESGPSTATSIAGELSISRQAVAKHLAILADAGMAASSRVGRETRFEADLAALAEVQAWIHQVESEWQQRLRALAQSLRPALGENEP